VWHVELRKVINIDIFCHQSVVLATDAHIAFPIGVPL